MTGVSRLEIASPLLLHGADSRGAPEPRTAPVRGLLRYWLRAGLRGVGADTDVVRSVEGKLFGTSAGNGGASRFRFLLEPEGAPGAGKEWQLLPHRTERQATATRSKGFSPSGALRLRWFARPSISRQERDVLLRLLPVAFACGGIGLRARRGFGTLQLQDAQKNGDVTTLIEAFREALQPYVSRSGGAVPSDVPCLAKERAVILESMTAVKGRTPADNFNGALELVMHAFHSHRLGGRTFGGVGPRFASAIHVRVFATSDPVHLRFTVFRVAERDDRAVAGKLRSLFDALNAKPVWGVPWWR